MGARILVVDDSNTIRRVVCGILERHGFEPAPAADGQIAVEALTAAETPFDLVLLDFVMPKMNGFQFCRAIRAREEWKRLPVLLMSAKTDRIREQFVQQTGAIDAITKPFDAQALIAAIENALKRVAAGQIAPAAPLVFDDSEALSTRSPAVREEHAIRARATADFAAQLGNVLAPVIAKLPQNVLADRDEGRIMEALTSKIDKDQIAQLARAVHAVDLSEKNAVVLTGNLGAIPIGAVLQLLQLEAQTGTLAIWNADSEVTIHMRGGLVDLVQSRGAGDEFRLGRFFLEQELVNEDQLEEIVRSSQVPPASGPASSQPSRLLGDMLVEAGHVNETQLREALTKQSSELIYEVLRWQAGRFEFRQRVTSQLAERARLAMPVASIVMEGFRRVDEWRVIEARLGSFDQVLLPDPASVDSLGDEKLARAEQSVLEAIDGERTVREVIAASHLSSFDACRILFQLIEARLVRRKAA
jgi:DNA-binding response OmpR family regulator